MALMCAMTARKAKKINAEALKELKRESISGRSITKITTKSAYPINIHVNAAQTIPQISFETKSKTWCKTKHKTA